MKKLSLILVLSLLLSLFAPTAVSAAAIAAEVESNNTANTANAITSGKIQGSLSTGKDVDFYKFEANQDYFTVTFNISAENLSADVNDGWVVFVYGNNDLQNPLFEQSTKTNFTTPRFPVSGTIYVKVVSQNSSDFYTPVGVSYDVSFVNTTDATWEDEANGENTLANALAANNTYHGSLQSGKDQDWFKITSADYFNVEFSRNTLIGTSYDVNDGWLITLYDADMKVLESISVKTTKQSFNYPVTGTVYVKVAAQNTSNFYAPVHVYYDIQINTVTSSTWENEYNDTSSTATVIKQGTQYHGNLQIGNDLDFYKVKSTTKAIAVKFDISLNEVNPDDVNDGWKITIYAADSAKSLASYTVDTVGSFKSITLPYAKGGYYFVKVEAVNHSNFYAPVGQPYHISVIDASDGKDWEVETGKTGVKSATTLGEGKRIYGNLCASSDQDYYKCKVVSGGTIKVSFKRAEADNDQSGYKIKVINSAGKEIYSYVVDDLTSKTSSSVKVSEGTYYIVVTPESTYSAPGADIDYSVSFALTLSKPSIKSITPTKNTLKVSWAKRSDVTGYEIQYATNKSFSGAKTIKISKNSTTSTTIKSTSASKTYYVRIRTVVKDTEKTYYSAWSSAKIAVNTPSVQKVTPSKNTLKVSWDKNTGATGYEIQYSTSKSFSSAKTVKISKNSTTSVTIKNTSANKTYYVRIRTVVKDSTTYYSLWSSAYSVKAK